MGACFTDAQSGRAPQAVRFPTMVCAGSKGLSLDGENSRSSLIGVPPYELYMLRQLYG